MGARKHREQPQRRQRRPAPDRRRRHRRDHRVGIGHRRRRGRRDRRQRRRLLPPRSRAEPLDQPGRGLRQRHRRRRQRLRRRLPWLGLRLRGQRTVQPRGPPARDPRGRHRRSGSGQRHRRRRRRPGCPDHGPQRGAHHRQRRAVDRDQCDRPSGPLRRRQRCRHHQPLPRHEAGHASPLHDDPRVSDRLRRRARGARGRRRWQRQRQSRRRQHCVARFVRLPSRDDGRGDRTERDAGVLQQLRLSRRRRRSWSRDPVDRTRRQRQLCLHVRNVAGLARRGRRRRTRPRRQPEPERSRAPHGDPVVVGPLRHLCRPSPGRASGQRRQSRRRHRPRGRVRRGGHLGDRAPRRHRPRAGLGQPRHRRPDRPVRRGVHLERHPRLDGDRRRLRRHRSLGERQRRPEPHRSERLRRLGADRVGIGRTQHRPAPGPLRPRARTGR